MAAVSPDAIDHFAQEGQYGDDRNGSPPVTRGNLEHAGHQSDEWDCQRQKQQYAWAYARESTLASFQSIDPVVRGLPDNLGQEEQRAEQRQR